MIRPISISGRKIGPGQPVYVVAEISANHRQDYEAARELVRVAHRAGADAVKLQTYTADTLTLKSERPEFRISGGTLWDRRTLHDLYQEAYTPWEWQPKLKEEADRLGITLFSTPFDESAVTFLAQQGMPAYKIASFEMVDLGLIRKAAACGKPMILSTGMASLEEIEEALAAARSAGAQEIALLKCTSAYPALPEDMTLATMADMAQRFQVPVGLSDHTLGIAVPVAAVALGAAIIEKHITLSRSEPSPDSAFSLEPEEFKAMVEAVHVAQAAIGTPQYGPSEHEKPGLAFRRSLFVTRDMKAGETFTERCVRSIRPSHGLHTRHLPEVLGCRAARNIEAGTPLSWDLVEGGPAKAKGSEGRR